MKQTTFRSVFWVTFLLVGMALPRLVFAEDCLAKLNTSKSELTRYQRSSRQWAAVWGLTWTTATVSQLTIATVIHNPETRKDLWVGSASAAIGVVPTWIIPPEATRDFELNGDCEEELSQAESLAKRHSGDTEIYNGMTAQIGNIAGNLTTSLILGLAFGHWSAAAISSGIGIPLGEAMILSYPKFGDEDYKKPSVALVSFASSPMLAFSFEF